MKRICGLLLICILLALICVPFSSSLAFAAVQAKVNAAKLNIREKPVISSKAIGKLINGQTVTILEQKTGWSKISFSGKYGWVSSDYLKQLTSEPAIKVQTGYTTINSLNVRQSASESSKSLGILTKGTAVNVLSQQGSWLKVTVPTKKLTGWISKTYISFKPISAVKPPASVPAIVVKMYTTANPALNLREQSNTQAKVLEKLPKGTAVQLSEKTSEWGKVKTPSGKSGWVSLSYLTDKAPSVPKPAPAPAETKPAEGKFITLLTDSNLRIGPGTEYEIIKIEKKGSKLERLSTAGEWAEVKTAAGDIVWVSSKLTAPSPENPDIPESVKTLAGKVIVLDAGHGGKDPGTSGKATGEEVSTLEKTVNLQTVQKISAVLQQAGAKVIHTRTTDTYLTLSQRVNVSHAYNADVFISVHYNAPGSSSTGIDTFFYPTNVNEQKLATYMQEELIKHTAMANRGVKEGNFQVIRENKKPAILLELGFLSNPKEAKLVKSPEYQEKVAQGVYKGLVRYFES
ncbi:hypothetical protein CVD28_09580 [Bacillus sp. M6-12]|uniref:N-acetylmuramoyl-L-alanine amidase n=1 Tax=Bacillus sp. M6-12 TaxID=2054166 RepID=UPI000C771436|nr:N-acetylmuramoyl-L-alanine amidase [Bacillus sp. M6-12]PLS17928.1 hypothetical protein CVD28_09580 [Bacillus sp. M6-12]